MENLKEGLLLSIQFYGIVFLIGIILGWIFDKDDSRNGPELF